MLEIIIILALIFLNGAFSLSEISIVTSSKIRLEHEAEAGDKKAQKALELANSPNNFLSAVQIGITLIGIISGVYGGATLAEKLNEYLSKYPILDKYSETVSYVIVIFIITYLSLVIGELLPKRLGMVFPEKIAKAVAGPMRIVSMVGYPFIWLLSISTNGLLKLLGVKATEREEVSEEEISSLIEKGTESGTFREVEHDIVESLFFLSDRNVGSLMKSKVQVILLDLNDEEEMRKKIAENPYYIFPVYQDSPNNIIGVLNTKKVLSRILQSSEIDYRSLLSVPLFVPVRQNALRLLEDFRTHKSDFAIVVDEFGSFTGIVTLRDLFDALVGDVEGDTHQEGEIIAREGKSWLVDGKISFDELLRYFDIEDHGLHNKHDFHTLGGFVMVIIHKIPVVGEKFQWEGYEFEVVDMDGLRVDKVLITLIE